MAKRRDRPTSEEIRKTLAELLDLRNRNSEGLIARLKAWAAGYLEELSEDERTNREVVSGEVLKWELTPIAKALTTVLAHCDSVLAMDPGPLRDQHLIEIGYCLRTVEVEVEEGRQEQRAGGRRGHRKGSPEEILREWKRLRKEDPHAKTTEIDKRTGKHFGLGERAVRDRRLRAELASKMSSLRKTRRKRTK